MERLLVTYTHTHPSQGECCECQGATTTPLGGDYCVSIQRVRGLVQHHWKVIARFVEEIASLYKLTSR